MVFVKKSESRKRNQLGATNESQEPNETEQNDWENEDADLLNKPELLYRECERIGMPSDPRHVATKYAKCQESFHMLMDLMLHHNPLQAVMEKTRGDEMSVTEKDLVKLVENVGAIVAAEKDKYAGVIQSLTHEQGSWTDEELKEFVSKESAIDILEWKRAVNEFLDFYAKIRPYIPTEAFQPGGETEQERSAKERWEPIVDLEKGLSQVQRILRNLLDTTKPCPQVEEQ